MIIELDTQPQLVRRSRKSTPIIVLTAIAKMPLVQVSGGQHVTEQFFSIMIETSVVALALRLIMTLLQASHIQNGFN